MNCVDAILYHCRSNPAATAIGTPGSAVDSIKYGQLPSLMQAVAGNARKAGLRGGQIVAIHTTDAIVHAALALGLMSVGIATISLLEPTLPDDLTADAIATDRPQLFSGAANVVAIDASWLKHDTSQDGAQLISTGADDICRIELALDRRGRRRAVAISRELLATRLAHDRVSKGALFARVSRLFSTFSVASSEGFNVLLHMLTQGGTAYYPGRDPVAILQFLVPYRVQALSTSPEGLEALLQYFEGDDTLESSFDVILCEAAGLSRDLSDRARARLCPNLYVCYAPVETSTVACASVEMTGRTLGAVGILCPGVMVDVIGADGLPLPLGREGSIRIRSPYLASDYIGGPRTGAPAFQNNAFHAGITGHVTTEGLLVLSEVSTPPERPELSRM
jgi:acyl-CoA synthetase (AMP-forming)/AMP-acid ligase II